MTACVGTGLCVGVSAKWQACVVCPVEWVGRVQGPLTVPEGVGDLLPDQSTPAHVEALCVGAGKVPARLCHIVLGHRERHGQLARGVHVAEQHVSVPKQGQEVHSV